MNEYMKEYPINFHVRMKEKMRDEAQKLANELGISHSALFRLALKDFIEQQKNKYTKR